MTKIAFVTYRQSPALTTDDVKVRDPLTKYGIKLHPTAWDDTSILWTSFDAVILRSCWDYHLRLGEFLLWLDDREKEGVSLWNAPPVVRWNADKTYLRELEADGIACVPTVFLEAGQSADLPAIMDERGWGQAVIKPTVGASAHKTWRISRDQAAQQPAFDKLLASSGVMVQPFLTQITTTGEWSLIFFRAWGGDVTYSHAVISLPAAGDMRVQEEYGGQRRLVNPPEFVLSAAQRVVAAIRGDWMYARVDGVVMDEQFLLMELELIEPDLFLTYDKDAAGRFAAAITSLF